MSFKRQVAYNTTFQITGKAIITVISVLSTLLLTRYLGPTGYGHYNIAITFVGFFIVLADLGVYPIAVREMSQHPEEREKIYGNVVTYRVFSALLTMGLAFMVGALLPYPVVVKYAIGIYAISSFVGLLVNLVMAIFQINYRMDLPTIADVLGRTLYLLLLFFAIQRHCSLYVIFWLLVISMAFNLILNLILGRHYIKLKPAFDAVFIKSFLKESLPMGIATILGTIHFKIDTILLSFMKPAFDVGIYGASYRIFETLILLPSIFAGLVFPRLSELYYLDQERFKQTFQKVADLLILMVVPTMIIFYFLAPNLIQIVAGNEFHASILTLRILILSLFATFLISIFAYTIIAAKHQRYLIYVWAVLAAINIILNLLLIPRFSYKGAAIVTVITESITLIVLYILTKKLIKIRLKITYLFRVLLPALVLGILFWAALKVPVLGFEQFNNFSLLRQIAQTIGLMMGGIIIYSTTLLLFRIVSVDYLRELLITNKKGS